MGQYEKDKKELLEKIEQLEHKLKKAKQSGDKDDVDKYSRKLADRRAKLASLGIEDFLAGGGGGMAMAAMGGLLLSMALGDH